MNDEPLYRNKEWLYDQFVLQGKECSEIARENGWTARVVQKWVQEKNGWRNHTRRDEVKPTDRQLQIIYGGMLGDGCISKRLDIDFTQYIFVQVEHHKDYVNWVLKELWNLCKSKTPSIQIKSKKGFEEEFIYNYQPTYRIATRGYKFLTELYNLSNKDIIDRLDELGLSLYFLDDGCFNKSKQWELCMGSMDENEVDFFINIMKEKFNIDIYKKYLFKNKYGEYWYVKLTVDESKKLNEIILRNIPNELDVIQRKIFRNGDTDVE